MFGRNKARIKEGIFAHIPLDCPGGLYVSPMPYGPYDRFNRLMKIYRRHDINRAVVLVTQEEINNKGRKDLLTQYAKSGIKTIHHPLPDLTAPRIGSIRILIDELHRHLIEGKENLVVHCNAGVGRTGVITACLIQKVTGCTGDESLKYVETYMLINMTDGQKRFVRNWNTVPAE